MSGNPHVSIVVCAYNMARELPRTLETLSPLYQRGCDHIEWEIIVVDNGSVPPVCAGDIPPGLPAVRLVRPDNFSPSPATAINDAMTLARAPLVGLFIDGARMATPGMIRLVHQAWLADPARAIGTLGFHFGPDVQMVTVPNGYDAVAEDTLLESVPWRGDGYRLFEISVLSGSSRAGWGGCIMESNALFMDRQMWDALGGLDERFRCAGGGFCNLDLWTRAVAASGHEPWIIQGEATFHQVHGGAATNGSEAGRRIMADEYRQLHGCEYGVPRYAPRYIGSLDHLPPRRSQA